MKTFAEMRAERAAKAQTAGPKARPGSCGVPTRATRVGRGHLLSFRNEDYER